MKIGVITFPGSNCDADARRYFQALGTAVSSHWYQDEDLKSLDMMVLPGGFSYGDYLRAGAIAARCSILESLRTFIKRGGWVLGICNGFQILTEAGLLPGALTQNASGKFQCEVVDVEVATKRSDWIPKELPPKTFSFPIAHAEGRFVADDETLKRLEGEGQIVWRYTRDVNGSAKRIAGISEGRILGMMPHPERHPDGRLWLESWLKNVRNV